MLQISIIHSLPIAVSVGFLESTYNGAEGDTLQVSVGVLGDTVLGGEITLLVSFIADSAQGILSVLIYIPINCNS